jgi:predicted Fe-Mo cluster-binding NifX family protein
MKIAIAAASTGKDAPIAMHGARAPYFLLFDTEHGTYQALVNPAARIERGAGPAATEFLLEHGVQKVVAGDFGPRFRGELESHGITCTQHTGIVAQATAETRQ